jgi:hypothetical protein
VAAFALITTFRSSAARQQSRTSHWRRLHIRADVVVFDEAAKRNPLIVDAMTARFLGLVDGQMTVDEILRQLDRNDSISTSIYWAQWIENLFRWGLIGLRHIDLKA